MRSFARMAMTVGVNAIAMKAMKSCCQRVGALINKPPLKVGIFLTYIISYLGI